MTGQETKPKGNLHRISSTKCCAGVKGNMGHLCARTHSQSTEGILAVSNQNSHGWLSEQCSLLAMDDRFFGLPVKNSLSAKCMRLTKNNTKHLQRTKCNTA